MFLISKVFFACSRKANQKEWKKKIKKKATKIKKKSFFVLIPVFLFFITPESE